MKKSLMVFFAIILTLAGSDSFGNLLDVPEDNLFSIALYEPNGSEVFFLSRDNPTAIVNLEPGIHTLEIIHGGGTDTNRAVFIKPGNTVIGKDSPDCGLAGATLSYANLTYADLGSAGFEGADVGKTDTPDPCPPIDPCDQDKPGQGCYLSAPAGGGCNPPYGDWTNMYFLRSDEDGKISCPSTYIEVTGKDGQEYVNLSSTSYWMVEVEDSFYKQRFQCLIKTSDDGTWDLADKCSKPGAEDLPICNGCQYIKNTAGDDSFRPGCIPQDNSLSSYPRVYLLDHNNGNLLFRGSKPCVTKNGAWEFDYDNIMKVFRDLYKIQLPDGSGFPDTFRFIDISLIDNTGQQNDILETEYEFFEGTKTPQPSPATQPANELFCKLDSPEGTTATVTGQFRWRNRKPCDTGNDNNGIDTLVDEISKLMDNQTGIPYVIYFHCDAGSDRTGEVAISYLLKNRIFSPENAFLYGTTIFKLQGTTFVKSRDIPKPDYLTCASDYCTSTETDEISCDYSSMDDTILPESNCPYPWSPGCP